MGPLSAVGGIASKLCAPSGVAEEVRRQISHRRPPVDAGRSGSEGCGYQSWMGSHGYRDGAVSFASGNTRVASSAV